jgi:hypothetical protein
MQVFSIGRRRLSGSEGDDSSRYFAIAKCHGTRQGNPMPGVQGFGFLIPSFFIRERKVDGLSPRILAAPRGPCTTQSVRSSTRMM